MRFLDLSSGSHGKSWLNGSAQFTMEEVPGGIIRSLGQGAVLGIMVGK